MIVDCRDDTTVTSSAAGFPRVQEGKNTSASRDWLLLLGFLFSSKGLNFEETREEKKEETVVVMNIISSFSTY